MAFDQYGEFSSAGQGAASGATAGAGFGPWGALIGGVVGAGYGYYKGRAAKRRAKKAEKLARKRYHEFQRRLFEDQRREQQSTAEILSRMGRQVGAGVGQASSQADQYVLDLANTPFTRGLWDLNWSERMRQTGMPSPAENRADAIGNAMLAGSGVASAFGGTSQQPRRRRTQGVQVS